MARIILVFSVQYLLDLAERFLVSNGYEVEAFDSIQDVLQSFALATEQPSQFEDLSSVGLFVILGESINQYGRDFPDRNYIMQLNARAFTGHVVVCSSSAREVEGEDEFFKIIPSSFQLDLLKVVQRYISD